MNPNSSDPNSPTPAPGQNPPQQDLGGVQPANPAYPQPGVESTPIPPPAETPLPDLTSTTQMPPPEQTSTPLSPEMSSTPSAPSEPMSTFSTSTTPENPPPLESGITPTFTPPPPTPVDSGPAGNPTNSSDFSAPVGFNWPDNQNAASNPIANNASNIPNPTTGSSFEPAPSDLSHLVNASEGAVPVGQEPTLPLAQPEALVPGGAGTGTEIPNIPTEETNKSFPKWIIGVGVGLLLAVAGASAYFILGIGKTPPPASTPATENQEQTTAPVIKPTVVPTIAIPSASPSAETSLPGSGTQATSAADLLRQRQGR